MLRGSFRPDALTGERHFRWRGGDVSRLEGLADAVFALALTLLVVRLDVPRTFVEVRHALVRAPVYAACFSIFLWIWYCHHQFHRRYGLEGPLTVALDGAVLFVVLLFALPLRFVADLLYSEVRFGGGLVLRGLDERPVLGAGGDPVPLLEAGDRTLLMGAYAGGFALVFALFAALTWTALRRRQELGLDELEVMVTRGTLRAHLFSAAVGVVALALALMGGGFARLAGSVFFLLGPGHGLLGWIQGRALERRAAADTILR